MWGGTCIDTGSCIGVGRCSVGSFCAEGSATGTFCAAGRFSNVTGLASPSGCLLCPRGHFCSGGRGEHSAIFSVSLSPRSVLGVRVAWHAKPITVALASVPLPRLTCCPTRACLIWQPIRVPSTRGTANTGARTRPCASYAHAFRALEVGLVRCILASVPVGPATMAVRRTRGQAAWASRSCRATRRATRRLRLHLPSHACVSFLSAHANACADICTSLRLPGCTYPILSLLCVLANVDCVCRLRRRQQLLCRGNHDSNASATPRLLAINARFTRYISLP